MRPSGRTAHNGERGGRGSDARHRGQLYAYTRALGVEPPLVWDFEHNEAAFAPQATAQA